MPERGQQQAVEPEVGLHPYASALFGPRAPVTTKTKWPMTAQQMEAVLLGGAPVAGALAAGPIGAAGMGALVEGLKGHGQGEMNWREMAMAAALGLVPIPRFIRRVPPSPLQGREFFPESLHQTFDVVHPVGSVKDKVQGRLADLAGEDSWRRKIYDDFAENAGAASEVYDIPAVEAAHAVKREFNRRVAPMARSGLYELAEDPATPKWLTDKIIQHLSETAKK